MLENGTIVDGKYKILDKIGQGGMSVVYLAMNEKVNKQWAIKEVRKDVTDNFEVVRQGLITETNLLKKLKHPNLPSIIDIIDTDETFLIVMDFIEGVTLSVYLEDNGPQPQEKVIGWASQLCDVLSYLHSRENPIIFRDIKPGNVMLKPNGDIVLIDFGIAREYKNQNSTDTVYLGTQGYAAPEQCGGHGQTDARTDIYCLGATMYHLLTGHNPSEPPYEMYPIRHWNESLSSGLEDIILKCTQKNPDDRFQNCEELQYELTHYQELDKEYQKKERKQILTFATFLTASVFCLFMALFFDNKAELIKTNTYDNFMSRASLEENVEVASEDYLKAIELNPEKSEAYVSLLERMLDDDVFTEEESIIIRNILLDNSSGSTNDTLFSKNTIEYEEFSYELGLAYFYSYEDKGTKSSAKKWLNIAANSKNLDSRKVERAKRLSEISEYYLKIGVQSKSGDASISYKDYWDDMVALSKGNIVEVDNEVTALIMYKEIAYQVSINAKNFIEDGVSREEIQKKLDDIKKHTATDIAIDSKNQNRVLELKENLDKNLEVAERELEIGRG